MPRFLTFASFLTICVHLALAGGLGRGSRFLQNDDEHLYDTIDAANTDEGQKRKKKCTCPPEASIEELVDTAENLLHVRIEGIARGQQKIAHDSYFAQVVTDFKGESDELIRLNVDNTCEDHSFVQGQEYIIHPEKVRQGKFNISPCSGSKAWNSLGKVQKKFLSRASTVIKTPADDPLPANLRVVDDQSVMESYESCGQLNKDLTQALRFYASNLIIGENFCKYKPGAGFLTPFGAADPGRQQDGNGGGPSTRNSETNKQFSSKEAADIVKYDETHVYLAYGDTLVVWNKRHGNETTRIVMPKPEDEIRGECENLKLNMTAPSAAGRPQFCFPSQSRAVIEGILLQENRLALIVSGYTVHFSRYPGKPGVLSDYGASTVRIYDTSNISEGEPPLLAKTELQGQFKEGRMIGSMAHIATTLRVNIQAHLDAELDVSKFRGKQGEEYKAAATEKAEEIIPQLVRRIVQELNSGNQCQSIAKLSAFMRGDLDEDVEISNEARCNLQDTISFETMVKVTSFNMLENLKTKENNKLAKISTGSSVAFFSKEGPAIVTASNNRMIFTANGYHWNETALSTQSFTYILTFELSSENENFEAVPSTFGFVDGYPVTEFAIDEHRGHLRIGTTKGDEYYCIETVRKEDTGEVLCSEWESYAPESQVIVLKYSRRGGSMTEVGRIEDLGEGEELRAVVFDGDKAFASTFGINEPLNSLDLSDPENPVKSGLLEVSGFSTYLHLIEDGRFAIGVGEVTNDLGFPLGLAVSLFDVSNLENPRLAAEYEFEDDNGEFVWSDALFDPKSFRYLPGQQRLILPLKIEDDNNNESVDGFAVLFIDLDQETITYEFTVNHAAFLAPSENCLSLTYVPSRSIVTLGRLITMKGHAVVSTGMNSQQQRYSIVLDEDRIAGCDT